MWTLYFGPHHQLICTLETGVDPKRFDSYEMAYRIFFLKHKDFFHINGLLNENLKSETNDKKINNILKIIEKRFGAFKSNKKI